MDFSAALLGSLSHEKNVREQSARALEMAEGENFETYMMMLSQELANDSKDMHVRVAAGLAAKNALVAKDVERREGQEAKWKALSVASRNSVKANVLKALGSTAKVGTSAAQVLAAIAHIELPKNQWPELMQILLGNVTNPGTSADLAKSTLEAIGFICETIDPEILENRSSEILTAVINGLSQSGKGLSVRIAAARALVNSVHFIQRHFDNVNEATVIMQTVCEAAASTDNEQLSVAALECLNEIVQAYYEKMGQFIGEGIAQMTIQILEKAANKSDPILLQAIEFWSCLSEVERDLELDAADSPSGTSDSFYFVKRFSGMLLPPLLNMLTRQPSEDSMDEWCPSMAASTCLALLAECLRDGILEGSTGSALVQFVEMNLVSASWNGREAGVMAFGSVLDGPSDDLVAPLVQKHLTRFVELLANDSSVAVQDAAAWAIGKICDFHLSAVPDQHIPLILQVLTHCLSYAPRVSVNCCWSLMTICIHLGAEDDSIATSPVSGNFQSIGQALLTVIERSDADECNLLSAGYQSLAAILLHAPNDMVPLLGQFQEHIVSRLEASLALASQLLNADDFNRMVEVQSHLCTLLQSTIKKTGKPSVAIADRTMQVSLSILQTATTSSTRRVASAELEDVLLLIGALASEMEGDFVRFTDPLVGFLGQLLEHHQEETNLVIVAYGLVGDLARALGPLLIPHCNLLMTALIQGLHSPLLARTVKPHIIPALGDISMAIGGAFACYLDVSMSLLCQASKITVSNPNNFDEVDFVVLLRESLLEAFTCLVQGFRDDANSQAILPYLAPIIEFLQLVTADPERTDTMVRSAAGLIGDLVDTFASHLIPILSSAWLLAFLQSPLPNRSHPSPNTEATIRWAQQTIQKAKAA